MSRLFHAIVIVGTAMGCSSSDSTEPVADAKVEVAADTAVADTFPGIMPARTDSGVDSFPTISVDTGAADTFPGIMPAMDAFPPI